jgi:hypothetical protein
VICIIHILYAANVLSHNFEGRNPNLADKTTRFVKKLSQIDLDGLPFVGAYLEQGDALYRLEC